MNDEDVLCHLLDFHNRFGIPVEDDLDLHTANGNILSTVDPSPACSTEGRAALLTPPAPNRRHCSNISTTTPEVPEFDDFATPSSITSLGTPIHEPLYGEREFAVESTPYPFWRQDSPNSSLPCHSPPDIQTWHLNPYLNSYANRPPLLVETSVPPLFHGQICHALNDALWPGLDQQHASEWNHLDMLDVQVDMDPKSEGSGHPKPKRKIKGKRSSKIPGYENFGHENAATKRHKRKSPADEVAAWGPPATCYPLPSPPPSPKKKNPARVHARLKNAGFIFVNVAEGKNWG